MRALERRQAILEAVCERRAEKVDNLAFEFGVHRNTILNDILELSLSYPIYTKAGRHDGGVFVADGFYLGTVYLNEKQKDLLKRLCDTVSDKDKEILESILTGFSRPVKK